LLVLWDWVRAQGRAKRRAPCTLGKARGGALKEVPTRALFRGVAGKKRVAGRDLGLAAQPASLTEISIDRVDFGL
jgi:hypothetical protein